MFTELLSGFLSSSQGQGALGALQQKGYSADDAQALLDHAIPAAAAAMHKQTEGQADPAVGMFNIFGGHAKRSFFEGVVAGILRGDGFVGSIEDGGIGLISGHIADVIAERAGLDADTASMVASAVTPFIVHYAHEKLAAHPSNN